jgi:uncharacterized iron-regulated membrane protein
MLEIVMIDAETAEVVTTGKMPWYVSGLMLSQPLHFGDYGGMGFKLLWLLLDLLSILVLWSGLVLWWKRRKVAAPQSAALESRFEKDQAVQPRPS